MGDRLIQAVAALLTGVVPAARGADAFRIGGDEFAILLPRGSPAQLDAVADRLVNAEKAARGARPA